MRLVLTEKDSIALIAASLVVHNINTSHFFYKNVWIRTAQETLVRGTIEGYMVLTEDDADRLLNTKVFYEHIEHHFLSFTHNTISYELFKVRHENFEFDNQPEFWHKKVTFENDYISDILALTKYIKDKRSIFEYIKVAEHNGN